MSIEEIARLRELNNALSDTIREAENEHLYGYKREIPEDTLEWYKDRYEFFRDKLTLAEKEIEQLKKK